MDRNTETWRTSDPVGYVDGGDVYEYVRCSPVGGVDPMGLADEQPTSQPTTLPTTLPAGQFVINDDFPVKMGKWHIAMLEYHPGDPLVKAKGRHGLWGTIRFTPDKDNCPITKKVRIIQVAREWDYAKRQYLTNQPFATDAKRGIEEGWQIDVGHKFIAKGSGASIYYNDLAPSPAYSKEGSNDGKEPTPAQLFDGPGASFHIRTQFEDVAVNDEDGTFLGAIKWGFVVEQGKVTLLPITATDSPSRSAQAAIAAYKAWVKP
jgi:hypothetical protein